MSRFHILRETKAKQSLEVGLGKVVYSAIAAVLSHV